ncbi:hypothetical protein [Natrinema sp. DC36]|uniref:hypothetical protein n=1 Tax=Natrinema sp. DC36 TaxID=2878680 RepID=UPI001CF0485C|nr:hypothetical protein [Natrinema sp. DC36]
MKFSYVSLVCVIASLTINGAISAVTNTATLLAVTPAGIAIYLIVGFGGPQAFLGQQTDSSMQLGTGVLTIILGLISLGLGALGSGILTEWGLGFINLLTLLGIGMIWASIWGFEEGYSSIA